MCFGGCQSLYAFCVPAQCLFSFIDFIASSFLLPKPSANTMKVSRVRRRRRWGGSAAAQHPLLLSVLFVIFVRRPEPSFSAPLSTNPLPSFHFSTPVCEQGARRLQEQGMVLLKIDQIGSAAARAETLKDEKIERTRGCVLLPRPAATEDGRSCALLSTAK